MKNLYSTILVVLAFSFCTQIQAQRHDQMSKIEKHLSLTAEQSSLIEALHVEMKNAFEALPEDATREDKRLIKESFTAKLKEILTEDQLEKFENRKGRRGMHSEAHGKGKGKFKFDGQKNRRVLTDDQKSALREARQAFDAKLSSEDKALIDDLRVKFKAKKKVKALRSH